MKVLDRSNLIFYLVLISLVCFLVFIDFSFVNDFIFYIVFFVGMVRKSSKFLGTNFKNSNIIKKVGLVLIYFFLIFVLVMPFFIAVDVFG